MKVGHLIKVLEELDPDYDIFYTQSNGVLAPILSVQEMNFAGFKPNPFIGLCCGKSVDGKELRSAPVYVSQQKQPL